MRKAGFENYQLQLPPADKAIIPSELLVTADWMMDPTPQPGDFSTGSLSLNRMLRHMHDLTFEQRRGLIYGGDQLVP